MRRLLILLIFLPTAALSEEILSAKQFQELAEGKTLYFTQQGRPYGAEQYMPGQKTVWQYSDGTCVKGIWFIRAKLICFVYDGDTEEQCWEFLKKDSGFAARATGRDPEDDLNVAWSDKQPLTCKAPGVGV